MVKPTKEQGAILAESAYFMGRQSGEFKKKKDRVARVNNWLEESGISNDYTFIPSSQDLATDIGFAAGLGALQPDLKRRTERTNDIIKELKPTNLNLVGHSLGGIANNYVIANSKKVRKNLTSSQTYNAGFNPVFASGVAVSDKNKEKLKKKVTHYTVKGDPVSFGARGAFKEAGVPFGKTKMQEHKYEKGMLDKGVAKFVLDNTIIGDMIGVGTTTLKGLHAHGLDQFYDVPPPKENDAKKE